MKDFDNTYTLIEALAECYDFNPKKKKESQIVFEITDDNEPGKWLRFGKHWNKIYGEYNYFEWEKNCPSFQCDEKHFVSNLMTTGFASRQMHYGAQQGTFKVRKIFDSRIDDDWHSKSN